MNPFTLLQQILGTSLSFFYSILPNYGMAIILLTVAVSLLLFPLTLKQTRSMKAMQEIQPEVKKLQKELKGDREELNKQLMDLYKERGVNPAAGCLPLLLQLPIWFALFRVLQVKVNDAGTGLSSDVIPDGDLADALIEGKTGFLTMDLLTSPATAFSDGFANALPYIILVVLVMVTGYYQQWQTTRRRKGSNQEQTPQQQSMQTVAKIMPLFLGFISWTFPTGLVLYFAASAIFRIGQQAVILRMDDDEGAQDDEADEDAEQAKQDPKVDKPQRKGPSPHASKKKKRRRK
jgi:YidC/Oxa1 family membrane protein insertase